MSRKLNKQIGVTALIVAPILVGLFLLLWFPKTSSAVADDLLAGLQQCNSESLLPHLYEKEAAALSLTKLQQERILAEVLCPDFKALQVNFRKKELLAAAYEKYYLAPIGQEGTSGRFYLPLIEYKPGKHQTTLTLLILAITQAEIQVASRSGTEEKARRRRAIRREKLVGLGMNSLYDARNNTIQPYR